MQLTPDQQRLWQIFHPRATEEEARIRDTKVRFVHYTSAEAALNIFRNKHFWMRKTTCMSDFTEVQHGLYCLANAYSSESGNKFKSALNYIFEGFSQNIEELFNSWIPSIKLDTYITCFSEHKASDDTFGRLSMWRAYAANTGVALVFASSALEISSDTLKVYASPVAYLSDSDFQQEFARITNNIEVNADFIKQQGLETIKAYVFRMLRYAIVSIKNPCFREELEWRVVYSPSLDRSEILIKANEVIYGIPQPIYKIPLQGIPGVEIAAFIDRIIIGPTQYPHALWEAFTDLLKQFGVDKPNVYSSNIPLRT
jgi:hypothetical protein